MKKIENKSNTMKHIEKIFGKDIEEVLRQKYIDEKLTISEIAVDIGVSHKTIWSWMQQANITARKMKWE